MTPRFLDCLVGLSLAAAAAGAVGCSSGTTSSLVLDGGSNDASTTATGSCKSTYPVSSGAAQPCCTDWGPDACGASLFCAAFDGRTQATCYPQRSRLGGETCTVDSHCLANACDDSGVCKGVPGGRCTSEIGCGTILESETPYYCGRAADGTSACFPCDNAARDPACKSAANDAGAPRPGQCTTDCKTNADCQSTCPPLSGVSSACCDGATGLCYASSTPTCPL